MTIVYYLLAFAINYCLNAIYRHHTRLYILILKAFLCPKSLQLGNHLDYFRDAILIELSGGNATICLPPFLTYNYSILLAYNYANSIIN